MTSASVCGGVRPAVVRELVSDGVRKALLSGAQLQEMGREAAVGWLAHHREVGTGDRYGRHLGSALPGG